MRRQRKRYMFCVTIFVSILFTLMPFSGYASDLSVAADCGADGCMIAGRDVVGYCSRGSCQVLAVAGVMPSSHADCGVDGCMIAGTGVVGYCSQGLCRTLDVPGVMPSSHADCGADGCMIAGTGVVGYCSQGLCRTLDVPGVMPSSQRTFWRGP
jgi:hypothetical protein